MIQNYEDLQYLGCTLRDPTSHEALKMRLVRAEVGTVFLFAYGTVVNVL